MSILAYVIRLIVAGNQKKGESAMKSIVQRSIAVAISLIITALTTGYALGAKCVVVEANETANVAASTRKSTRTSPRTSPKRYTRTSTRTSFSNHDLVTSALVPFLDAPLAEQKKPF
jgi:hypothetical protein